MSPPPAPPSTHPPVQPPVTLTRRGRTGGWLVAVRGAVGGRISLAAAVPVRTAHIPRCARAWALSHLRRPRCLRSRSSPLALGVTKVALADEREANANGSPSSIMDMAPRFVHVHGKAKHTPSPLSSGASHTRLPPHSIGLVADTPEKRPSSGKLRGNEWKAPGSAGPLSSSNACTPSAPSNEWRRSGQWPNEKPFPLLFGVCCEAQTSWLPDPQNVPYPPPLTGDPPTTRRIRGGDR